MRRRAGAAAGAQEPGAGGAQLRDPAQERGGLGVGRGGRGFGEGRQLVEESAGGAAGLFQRAVRTPGAGRAFRRGYVRQAQGRPGVPQPLRRYASGCGPARRLVEGGGQPFPVGGRGRIGQQGLAGGEEQRARRESRQPLRERVGGVRRKAGEDVEELEAGGDSGRAGSGNGHERQQESDEEHAADGCPGVDREQGSQGRQDQCRGQAAEHDGSPLGAGAGDDGEQAHRDGREERVQGGDREPGSVQQG